MRTVRSGDGTTIAYDQVGEGQPVILVDGAFCSRSFGPMPKLAPVLAPHFRVFAYDRRGRGDSGDTAPYAVEREIENLDAMIRQAGGSAFVYAISSGAALALEAAASGLSIRKLALYEPPFMVGNPAHLPPVDHHAQLVRLVAQGRRGDAVKFYMKDIIGMPGLLVTVFRILPMWSKLKAVANSLPYDAAVMGDFSLPTRRAASLTMPTLVISGDEEHAGAARGGTAARGPHPRCGASHARRSDPQRLGGSHRPRPQGVLRAMKKFTSVNAYLKGVPPVARAALQKLRRTIKAAAPEATEVISYGIPSFKHHGYLVGFAAFKHHCSFFPGTALHAFKRELASYETSKGTIHFTVDKPLPAALVRKLVKARVAQNERRR
ncbi:MAG: alpha/beta fold hydrolase [Gemmatimonadales bacterium]